MIVLSAVLLTTACGLTQQQWTMPNLVGNDLNVAVKQIEKLTDYAIHPTSHNVNSRYGNPIIDKDWMVCSQNTPAGSTITSTTKIDFAVGRHTGWDSDTCP
jgi:beta-lactam-binding protein with PASTA domain